MSSANAKRLRVLDLQVSGAVPAELDELLSRNGKVELSWDQPRELFEPGYYPGPGWVQVPHLGPSAMWMGPKRYFLDGEEVSAERYADLEKQVDAVAAFYRVEPRFGEVPS